MLLGQPLPSLDQRTKSKLASLVKTLQPMIDSEVAKFESDEVNYVLTQFKQFLIFDLSRDFEKQKIKNLKDSPFDDIINGNM